MRTSHIIHFIAFALLIFVGCDEATKTSHTADPNAIHPAVNRDGSTSTSTGGTTANPPVAPVKATVAVPETQYPSKQLPLPTADRRTDSQASGSDPTVPAFRHRLDASQPAMRAGVAFQKFSIPDPLAESASLPLRTAIKDAEAPVSSNAGRPLPVLK